MPDSWASSLPLRILDLSYNKLGPELPELRGLERTLQELWLGGNAFRGEWAALRMMAHDLHC